MKAVIESQFAYSPLVDLFHSRTLNTKINLNYLLAKNFLLKIRPVHFKVIFTRREIPEKNSASLTIFKCKIKVGSCKLRFNLFNDTVVNVSL